MRKHDAPLRRNLGLALGDALLMATAQATASTTRAELDESAVAHELDDAAVVLGQQRVDHLAAQLADRGQRAGLVRLDQAGVADDVGGQDRRQPPLRPGHGRCYGNPPQRGLRVRPARPSACPAPGTAAWPACRPHHPRGRAVPVPSLLNDTLGTSCCRGRPAERVTEV